MRHPLSNPWPGNPNAYQCPWGCNGTGSMPWFAHIQGGVCFHCHGRGWLLGRGPAAPAKPRQVRQWRRVGNQLVEVAQ
jgi:hypothetical protein